MAVLVCKSVLDWWVSKGYSKFYQRLALRAINGHDSTKAIISFSK